MPFRVRAKNFQSIEDAEITVKGFTVITGRNNSGKTALMRAIYGAFVNAPSSSYLRHGTDALSVEIDFLDGHSLRWEKGVKTKPTYVIDGKTLHPGREVPSEVQALGVKSLTAGSAVIWPQIAPQLTGVVFLLDQSGAAVAEAVADVDRVSKLTGALKLAESDRRAAASELKTRRKDLTQAEDRLSKYVSLVDIEAAVEDARVHLSEIESLKATLAALEAVRTRMMRAQTLVDRHRAFSGSIPLLPAPMDPVISDVVGMEILGRRWNTAQEQIRRFNGVGHVIVPDMIPTTDAETADTLMRQSLRYTKLSRFIRAATSVASVDLPLTVGVTEVSDLQALAQTRQQYYRSRKVVVHGSKLEDVPALSDKVSKGVDLLLTLQTRKDTVQRLRTSLVDLSNATVRVEGQVSEVEREIHDLRHDLGECPLCGRSA